MFSSPPATEVQLLVVAGVGLGVVAGMDMATMDMDMDKSNNSVGGGVEGVPPKMLNGGEVEGDSDVGMSVEGAGVGDGVVDSSAGLRVGKRPPSDIIIERDISSSSTTTVGEFVEASTTGASVGGSVPDGGRLIDVEVRDRQRSSICSSLPPVTTPRAAPPELL